MRGARKLEPPDGKQLLSSLLRQLRQAFEPASGASASWEAIASACLASLFPCVVAPYRAYEQLRPPLRGATAGNYRRPPNFCSAAAHLKGAVLLPQRPRLGSVDKWPMARHPPSTWKYHSRRAASGGNVAMGFLLGLLSAARPVGPACRRSMPWRTAEGKTECPEAAGRPKQACGSSARPWALSSN
jgi:hypothetical protein